MTTINLMTLKRAFILRKRDCKTRKRKITIRILKSFKVWNLQEMKIPTPKRKNEKILRE